MDKSQHPSNGSTDATRPSHHPPPPQPPPPPPPSSLSRDPSATRTPRTDSWPAKLPSQSTHTSTQSSALPSPLTSRDPSRDPSPARQMRPSASRASSTAPGARSRKGSQPPSPTRPAKSSVPTAAPAATGPKALSAANTPSLPPHLPDPASVSAPTPQKPSTASDSSSRDAAPRWPISPRLRSPPPNLHKPVLPPPRKGGGAGGDQDSTPPLINVQRSSPSPQAPSPELQSDQETDESHPPSGMRTPARGSGGSTSTLETVQEASPLTSPRQTLDDASAKLAAGLASEPLQQQQQQQQQQHAATSEATATGETTASKSEARPEPPSSSSTVMPPPLTSRHSTTSIRPAASSKAKGDAPLQSMTVETETVTSIPQLALEQSAAQGPNGGLRTKPSSETIRPKKEKKKPLRKSPAVSSGTVSSKADIFEAKVASAVEEANSSDSEETFVYDSNPPDGRDRPHRFHSRTPSATSMMSQVDRNGMRSIPGMLESVGPGPGAKKNMKFVNVNALTTAGNDAALGDDDGRGTGRSGAGTARHHHHFGRWGRNSASSGPRSLFSEDSPFLPGPSPRSVPALHSARQSPGPSSPRLHSGGGRLPTNNGNKKSPVGFGGYDLDDTTTTGADDERTPLIQSTALRSARSGRGRRPLGTMRSMEQRGFSQPPSFLNRFASCLVLAVMLVLVISGAIGFMFATSQPLTNIELIGMKNVLASEQELMLDVTVRAKNPNVVVVVIDSADIEVFAKSPHAGTDSRWWRRPSHDDGTQFTARRRKRGGPLRIRDDSPEDPPLDDEDTAPNMRLGTIGHFDSPLSFEGSFFHQGVSSSTGEVRLQGPGNTTEGGSERWERILDDEFDLILKGVLKYSLPLSQRVRSVAISGRTHVKPNSANDPTPPTPMPPNGTDFSTQRH